MRDRIFSRSSEVDTPEPSLGHAQSFVELLQKATAMPGREVQAIGGVDVKYVAAAITRGAKTGEIVFDADEDWVVPTHTAPQQYPSFVIETDDSKVLVHLNSFASELWSDDDFELESEIFAREVIATAATIDKYYRMTDDERKDHAGEVNPARAIRIGSFTKTQKA